MQEAAGLDPPLVLCMPVYLISGYRGSEARRYLYYLTATVSISMRAPSGSPLTANAALAGWSEV